MQGTVLIRSSRDTGSPILGMSCHPSSVIASGSTAVVVREVRQMSAIGTLLKVPRLPDKSGFWGSAAAARVHRFHGVGGCLTEYANKLLSVASMSCRAVRHASGAPQSHRQPMRIRQNFVATDKDRATLRVGLRMARDAAKEAPLRPRSLREKSRWGPTRPLTETSTAYPGDRHQRQSPAPDLQDGHRG